MLYIMCFLYEPRATLGRILNRFSKDVGIMDEILPFTLIIVIQVRCYDLQLYSYDILYIVTSAKARAYIRNKNL